MKPEGRGRVSQVGSCKCGIWKAYSIVLEGTRRRSSKSTGMCLERRREAIFLEIKGRKRIINVNMDKFVG